MISLRSWLVFLVFVVCAAASPSRGETWPTRPINLWVGFAVGGSGDTTARVFGEFLAKEIGQPVIIENRAGSGGALAALALTKAEPDGYTILIQAIGPTLLRPLMDPAVGYDPEKDFTAIGLMSDTPNVILAGAKFPAKSIAEAVDLARKGKWPLTIGHPGPGTMGHLGALLLAGRTGVDATYISYRSGGQMMPDILGGQIDLGCAAYSPQFSTARILAVMTAEPVGFLPGVPSMRDAGFAGVYASTWYGIFGPPNLPHNIVAKLNATMNAFLQSDDAKRRLPGLGVRAIGGPPEALTKKIAEDKVIWSKIIKDANIHWSN